MMEESVPKRPKDDLDAMVEEAKRMGDLVSHLQIKITTYHSHILTLSSYPSRMMKRTAKTPQTRKHRHLKKSP